MSLRIDINRKKFLVIAIISGGIGFILGTMWGVDEALNQCARLASEFIEVDQDRVREMIEIYERYAWRIK